MQNTTHLQQQLAAERASTVAASKEHEAAEAALGRCSAERHEVDGELRSLQKRLAAAEREHKGTVGTSQSCQQSLAGGRRAAMADLPVVYIAAVPVLSTACAQQVQQLLAEPARCNIISSSTGQRD